MSGQPEFIEYGTGIAPASQHVKSCIYAEAVYAKFSPVQPSIETSDTQPDVNTGSTEDTLVDIRCAFGRTGRCALADIAVNSYFGVEIEQPRLVLLEMTRKNLHTSPFIDESIQPAVEG
jgi:hypothetical protein